MKRTIRPEVAQPLELLSSRLVDRILLQNEMISKRLDVVINVLLEILLTTPQYRQPAPYTNKAILLESLGLQINEISKIVGKPSNWVNSRLREAKSRKSPSRPSSKSKPKTKEMK